jgi:hypothetical protein
MFITNHVGNLAHKQTGDTDFRKYALATQPHRDDGKSANSPRPD